MSPYESIWWSLVNHRSMDCNGARLQTFKKQMRSEQMETLNMDTFFEKYVLNELCLKEEKTKGQLCSCFSNKNI